MIILSLISLLQVLNLSKHQIGRASACHADLGCPAAFIARISAPLEEMSASNLQSSCYQVKVTTALHWKGLAIQDHEPDTTRIIIVLN